ncbi:MAG: threonine synthase, partial [Ferruginibacter sp.]|nr:threonine synthase [Ferruginibacter sp.]
MKYFSLNNRSSFVDFKEATIRGQAPDKGLYFPEYIPMLDRKLINEIESLSNEEIAFNVIKPFVGDVISQEDLFDIVMQTVNFPVPLVKLNENIFSLEMYHGNTLAFKDIGARFMSRCLAHFVKDNDKKITVLVATSGDTGGAVADGFCNVDGVDVEILYTSGKVSKVQEKQLTSLGKNIHALEVKGTFDDCQQMVKKAFEDHELNQKLFLTSANSINVARWLPQQFFYFFAYKQWPDKSKPPVVCVPSGNFGNICSALLAHISGLPVKHFIAACNANDVVPDFMRTFKYKPKKAVATISNAMDVGDPSNFIRILELFESKTNELSSLLSAYSISDEETTATIQSVDKENNYLLDPHGAVGYLSLKRYLDQHTNEKGFFAETAHPVKFYDVVEPIINRKIELPQAIA